MLLGARFSWELLWTDMVIYVALQVARMWVDVALPERWFDPDRRSFRARRWERDGAVYDEHLGISRWKDRLPSLPTLERFSKTSLTETSTAYLRQFILETCRAESNHKRSIVETWAFLIWNPWEFFLVILALSTLGHTPFLLVQRYNRPRLRRLLALAAEREGTPGVVPGFQPAVRAPGPRP